MEPSLATHAPDLNLLFLRSSPVQKPSPCAGRSAHWHRPHVSGRHARGAVEQYDSARRMPNSRNDSRPRRRRHESTSARELLRVCTGAVCSDARQQPLGDPSAACPQPDRCGRARRLLTSWAVSWLGGRGQPAVERNGLAAAAHDSQGGNLVPGRARCPSLLTFVALFSLASSQHASSAACKRPLIARRPRAGENNVGRAVEYTCRFPAMIQDWRKRWAKSSRTDSQFPFLFVQLSPYGNGV